MNTCDYINESKRMLYSTYIDLSGNDTYYRTGVPKEVLKHHWARIKDTVEEGRQLGFISDSDALSMVPPEPKAGRFYG